MKISRVEKARQLRYRRAALSVMQRDKIDYELYDIMSECNELEWAVEDDETLLDVFNDDVDEINDFRIMFSDLSDKSERLYSQLQDTYITKYFDDFFVGVLGKPYRLVGYDSVEEDYYYLTSYEAERAQGVSGGRLMKLTKDRLIAVAGQCIGIMMSFLDIRHSHSCVKAIFDLLRDDRAELIKGVKLVEDAYQKIQRDPEDENARREYESLLERLPDRVWVE